MRVILVEKTERLYRFKTRPMQDHYYQLFALLSLKFKDAKAAFAHGGLDMTAEADDTGVHIAPI